MEGCIEAIFITADDSMVIFQAILTLKQLLYHLEASFSRTSFLPSCYAHRLQKCTSLRNRGCGYSGICCGILCSWTRLNSLLFPLSILCTQGRLRLQSPSSPTLAYRRIICRVSVDCGSLRGSVQQGICLVVYNWLISTLTSSRTSCLELRQNDVFIVS